MAGRAEIKCMLRTAGSTILAMENSFSSYIRLMSIALGVKKPKISRFAVFCDCGKPTTLFVCKDTAKEGVFLAAPGKVNIALIFGLRAFTQITASIIGAVAVYVVNHANRQFAIHVQEYETMGSVIRPVNLYPYVPGVISTAGDIALVGTARCFGSHKNSRNRIISKFIDKLLVRYRVFCHHVAFCKKDVFSGDVAFYHVGALNGW